MKEAIRSVYNTLPREHRKALLWACQRHYWGTSNAQLAQTAQGETAASVEEKIEACRLAVRGAKKAG